MLKILVGPLWAFVGTCLSQASHWDWDHNYQSQPQEIVDQFGPKILSHKCGFCSLKKDINNLLFPSQGNWPLLLPTFGLSFFLSLSSSVFCFWPTSRKLLLLEICFPQYFGITRRYMQKKCMIFFYEKKMILGLFLLFTASVWSQTPGPPLVPVVLISAVLP